MYTKRRSCVFIFFLLLFVAMGLSQGFAMRDLTHGEIEDIIEEVALEKNIPSVILKAIAWKESNYNQFNSKGQPFVSYGNTGIMQINKVHRHLDQERLKYDIRYNIEAGADVLLGRWNASGRTYPKVGNMDPNILENWYFALWGYNGWVARNNPNVSGQKAYQEGIFQLIREKYGQDITSIDWGQIPSGGLPRGDLQVATPQDYHLGDLDRLTNKIFKDITDHPKEEYIEELHKMGIISGVGEGLFKPSAFVTREQAAKIFVDALELDLEEEKITCQDWEEISAWARDHVATAYRQGLLSLEEEGLIDPDNFLTREEALTMIYKGFTGDNIEKEELIIPIAYHDFADIDPQAIDSVAYLIGKGVLKGEAEELLRPKDFVTRADICHWIYKSLSKL